MKWIKKLLSRKPKKELGRDAHFVSAPQWTKQQIMDMYNRDVIDFSRSLSEWKRQITMSQFEKKWRKVIKYTKTC